MLIFLSWWLSWVYVYRKIAPRHPELLSKIQGKKLYSLLAR
jgi:hypothetical protein